MKKYRNVFFILLLLCNMTFPDFFLRNVQAAGESVLTLEQARSLALDNSGTYRDIETKITLEEVKYTEAVKAAALKKKDMSTFRWSPLLSFQFPEQPDLADSYEWQYEPVRIQCEITSLKHEKDDLKYEIIEEVSTLYADAYVSQMEAELTEERKKELDNEAERIKIKRKTGQASEEDTDTIQKLAEKLDSELSIQLRELQTAKKKLSEVTGLDISTGYRFEDPLVTTELERSALEGMKAHALENDHACYEAKLDTKLALLSLETNERLMDSWYGRKMDVIRSYITQAKAGEEIDQEAFKSAYDSFMEKIEQTWEGSIRILFIKIPKEWFKGSLDGVRYIEDDPYVLLTDTLEYMDKKNEEESVKKALEENISDSFEALVTARNSYESLKKSSEDQEEALGKTKVLNKIGKVPYKEYLEEKQSFEELKADMLEALKEFNSLLYSFDRLTCGALTEYTSGDAKVKVKYEEMTVLGKEEQEGETYKLSYYIRTKVEDNLFVFGISVPANDDRGITSYELWVNGTRIGERTEAGKELRHLALVLDGIDKAEVRLYAEEDLLYFCEIDPTVFEGELKGGE